MFTYSLGIVSQGLATEATRKFRIRGDEISRIIQLPKNVKECSTPSETSSIAENSTPAESTRKYVHFATITLYYRINARLYCKGNTRILPLSGKTNYGKREEQVHFWVGDSKILYKNINDASIAVEDYEVFEFKAIYYFEDAIELPQENMQHVTYEVLHRNGLTIILNLFSKLFQSYCSRPRTTRDNSVLLHVPIKNYDTIKMSFACDKETVVLLGNDRETVKIFTDSVAKSKEVQLIYNRNTGEIIDELGQPIPNDKWVSIRYYEKSSEPGVISGPLNFENFDSSRISISLSVLTKDLQTVWHGIYDLYGDPDGDRTGAVLLNDQVIVSVSEYITGALEGHKIKVKLGGILSGLPEGEEVFLRGRQFYNQKEKSLDEDTVDKYKVTNLSEKSQEYYFSVQYIRYDMLRSLFCILSNHIMQSYDSEKKQKKTIAVPVVFMYRGFVLSTHYTNSPDWEAYSMTKLTVLRGYEEDRKIIVSGRSSHKFGIYVLNYREGTLMTTDCPFQNIFAVMFQPYKRDSSELFVNLGDIDSTNNWPGWQVKIGNAIKSTQTVEKELIV